MGIYKKKIVKELKVISKERAENMNKDFKNLYNKLKELQNKLEKETCNLEKEIIEKEVYECHTQLNRHMQYKAQGARIRSKNRWYTSGEVGSSYFLGLEKVRYSNKVIRKLILEDNTIVRDQSKILQEQYKFYKKLYTKDPKVKFALENDTEQKLTGEQKLDAECEFTFEEFAIALRQMSSEKTPGIDGLPCEVYKVFFPKIGKTLWNAVLYVHEKGILHRSARRGIITLIPKKQKRPEYLKNWRPLTLLSVDYKIITKMIANRFKEFLKDIIGQQQVGYVPGCFIGSNIRKLIDMLLYIEKEEIPAVLINLDYEKCFDSIDQDSLYKALAYFGIGEYLISWIKMVYNEFELYIAHNGHHTKYLKQTRGCHQGCALSGPAFLCVAETLACRIKQNPKIKGIEIQGFTQKMFQYADDASILSKYEEESVQSLIDELEEFQLHTGLKVNYEKSVMHPIGKAASEPRKRLYLSKKFKWDKEKAETLGIILQLDSLNALEEYNMESVLEKAKTVLQNWSLRKVSLQGKVTIVNALVANLFIYKMQVLPTLSEKYEARFKEMLTQFIWNGKKPKIRIEDLMKDKQDGGCRLANIIARDKALKVQWIKRVQEDLVLAALFKYFIGGKIQSALLWECNFKRKDILIIFKCKNKFWKSILEAWADVNFSSPQTVAQIANQVLWYNSHIRIANRPVVYKAWEDLGIHYYKDICEENSGRIRSYEQLQAIYGENIKEMEYNSLVSAIPGEWKKVTEGYNGIQDLEHQCLYNYLCKFEKWSPIVYQRLIEGDETINKIQRNLENIRLPKIETQRIHKICRSINSTIKIPKYQSFQYRMLHNAIYLNNRLYHMSVAKSKMCSMCHEEVETTLHFFVECRVAKEIFHEIQNYMRKVYDYKMQISHKEIITATVMSSEVLKCEQLIAVIYKQRLFAAKCLNQKPNTNGIVNEIEFIHEIEKTQAISIKSIVKYNEKWPDYISIDNEQSKNMFEDEN